ncbi:hypothetical protein ACP4OV_023310 [Aristida adscensionis]
MGRSPCCDKAAVKRGAWSEEEDARLRSYVERHGGAAGSWIALPRKAGLRRCGKSCRLRWLNYLRPGLRRGGFSPEEDRAICALYAAVGRRWSLIAAHLPGRTDNAVKNYWNTRLKKRLCLHLGLRNPPPPPPPPPRSAANAVTAGAAAPPSLPPWIGRPDGATVCAAAGGGMHGVSGGTGMTITSTMEAVDIHGAFAAGGEPAATGTSYSCETPAKTELDEIFRSGGVRDEYDHSGLYQCHYHQDSRRW